MTPQERLANIARLFGGASQLARALGISRSGITRRIKGQTPIAPMDQAAVEGAVARRVQALLDAVKD